MQRFYKILIAFGTRPELIKLAPVIKILDSYHHVITVNTGQHTTLLQQALETFKIKPDINLGCENIDLVDNFCSIAKNFRKVLKELNPDFILVQGDTLTTFSIAFVAFMEKKPIIHLEAGLRSGNKFSPFPEEMNRVLTDALADVYLTPTLKARELLLREGKREDRIFTIGNTIVDALLYLISNMNLSDAYKRLSKYLMIDLNNTKEKSIVLITSHRRENIGAPLEKICKAVRILSQKYKNCYFIWTLHKNPLVRSVIAKEFVDIPKNIIFVEALPYDLFILLMKDSRVILTDSGGIQEEAPTFKKPVLILRETTERPEILECGLGFLVGSDIDKIEETFSRVYDKSFNLSFNPFGDGKASQRFFNLLRCDNFYQFIKEYPKTYDLDLSSCKNKIDEFV
ncbi:MAG: UDP-N-acetylglucosamine 2-epimerase (non-hydrolyzing) [Candidatus Aenigmatarchaeota archaeon]